MRHVRTRRIYSVLKRGITNLIDIEEGDQMMVQTISRKDLKDKIDRGEDFVLVETLPEEQYRHTHLPGALNVPPDKLRELTPELLPDKEADIVVYCGSPT
jgi:rhodanese-related sulfurtransferase